MNPVRAGQEAAAARLLATPAVTDIVADTSNGAAVFARGQTFADSWPRVTLDTPQWIPNGGACGRSGDLIITLHSWAHGPDCTLVAGDLAAAVEAAFDAVLILTGWRVSSWRFEGSRPVGDPNASVEHIVSTLRLSVQRTA